MANVKLNFAHVCENAFLSQDSKINIIGDFDRISIKRLESAGILLFPFFVVTNFSVEPNRKYIQKITLTNIETNKEILNREVSQITPGEKVGLIMRVDAIFPSAGIYKVIIKLDDTIYNEIKIVVEEEK